VNFYLAANSISRLCQPATAARKAMVRRPQKDRRRAVNDTVR